MKLEHEFYIEHEDREFTVTVSAWLTNEHDYGADADGNRGIYMQWVDDIQVENISCEDNLLISEITKNIVSELAEKQADKHGWEIPERDYPEHDKE